MTLFIIGYMASGKTTFGRALARNMGMDFIDLDFYIEQRFHSSISDLFATRGEQGFRTLESAMLHEVGEFNNVVIACGGGTPCFNDNMVFMKSRGITIWLQAGVQRIISRLLVAKTHRPLVEGKSQEELASFIKNHLDTRIDYYSKAHIKFDGEHLEDSRQINNTINSFKEKYGRQLS